MYKKKSTVIHQIVFRCKSRIYLIRVSSNWDLILDFHLFEIHLFDIHLFDTERF